MKKVILIATVLLAVLGLRAQTGQTVQTDKYYISTVGNSADTVGATSTTWYKAYEVQVPQQLFYNFKVKVLETTTFACTIKLQGKIFDTDTYADITTITYAGAGTDTTVAFTQVSTKQNYRFYKVLVTRTAGKGSVSSIKGSFKY